MQIFDGYTSLIYFMLSNKPKRNYLFVQHSYAPVNSEHVVYPIKICIIYKLTVMLGHNKYTYDEQAPTES